MKCPNCGLINRDTALRCDCGFSFTPEETTGKSRSVRGRRSKSRLSPFEWFALVVWFAIAPGLYYSGDRTLEAGPFWLWIGGGIMLIWCIARGRNKRPT